MPNREIFNFSPETAPVSQSGGNPIEHTRPEEIKKDLFNFNEKVEKRTENQNEDFLKQLSEMDKRGATPENIIGIRRGAAPNDPDSLERHIRLSAAFTNAENNPATPGQKTISINFRGNNLAENYVGLGDILPPHAERVKVYGLEGQIITGGAVRKINPQTGRVHTSFAMAAAATGRLASTDPNLQNIPIRTAEGRRIRQAFVAPKG